MENHLDYNMIFKTKKNFYYKAVNVIKNYIKMQCLLSREDLLTTNTSD